MTGFDVPCCNTIYLDKLMRNHTLMQTIARANRVFKDKVNGLIVDYVGVFRNLQKALAIYGSGSGGGVEEGECPVKAKAFLVEQLRKQMAETESFCRERGIDLKALRQAGGFVLIKALDDAVEAILVSEESKRAYLNHSNWVNRLFKAILPDPSANEFGPQRKLFVVIAEKIRCLDPEVDISEVMEQVEALLDESVGAQPYVIRESEEKYGTRDGRIDIAKLDFEKLREIFNQGRKRTEFEKIKAALENKIRLMVMLNKTRMDYLEKVQQLIEAYNSGAANIEAIFEALLTMAKVLNEEERRHMREELSEEELAIFDLLTRPAPEMSDGERKQVKKVANELLVTLKREKLVLDWRKKEMTRAAVRQAIEIKLDDLPMIYEKELYEAKCDSIYQHVFEAYWGRTESIYSSVH
ncbi:MAG: type I restriction enzyme endonuclease domain-containing protein [Desulfuromonadales bacterium]